MFFKTFNQTIYSIYYFLNSLHTYFITLIFFHFSSNKIKKSFQNNPSGNANNLLFISWGFIGDALLSTSILRYFRDTFPGCKVIILGRETAKELLEPFCDEYIEFLPDKWKASSSYRKNLFQK